MQKVLLLIVSVITFKSSDIISIELAAQQIREEQQRRDWQIGFIAEELAKEKLGLGCTWWDLAAEMRKPEIWKAAEEKYIRRQNAETYR